MHVDPQREEENQVKREELRGPGAGKRSDGESRSMKTDAGICVMSLTGLSNCG